MDGRQGILTVFRRGSGPARDRDYVELLRKQTLHIKRVYSGD